MLQEKNIKSKHHQELFYQKSSDLFFFCDHQGTVVEANNRTLDVMGLNQVPPPSFFDLFPVAERERVYQAARTAPSKLLSRIRTSDGAFCRVNFDFFPHDQGFYVIGQDVEAQSGLQDLVEKYGHFLAEAQKFAAMGHFSLHFDTGVWESSETLDQILGTGEGFPRNIQEWVDLVHPDQKADILGYLQENILVRQENFDKIFQIVRPQDQTVRWVHGKGQVKLDEGGSPRELYGTIQDITTQKDGQQFLKQVERDLKKAHLELQKRQRELRDSEELFRKAFRTSPDAVVINTLEGIYRDINDGFCTTTGYTRDECIGNTSLGMKLWADPRDRQRMMAQLEETGECNNLEAWFQRKNGERILGLMSAKIIYLKGLPHILSITRDVTELRRSQEELVKVQKLESLGLLAGGIAHDFNNLFAGIFGFIELGMLSLDQEHQAFSYMEKAKNAKARSIELTHQLLVFSQGGSPLRRPVDLKPILQESAQAALKGSLCQIVHHCPPHLWPIDADGGQICQVVRNLIQNSRQANLDRGEIHVSAENLTLHENAEGRVFQGPYVKITVEDFGEGIAPDRLTQVFDPFYTTRVRSSGLGLSVCYSIVKKHQGFIRIVSDPGKGTRVHVFLPALPTWVVDQTGPPPLVGEGRLLLLDDEADIREVVGEHLQLLGFEVEAVASGEEALRHWKDSLGTTRAFRAGIFDLTLKSGMGGLDTSRAVLACDPAAKILVASGYSLDEVLAQPEKFGLAGSLRKPFAPEDLRRALIRILQTPQ